MNHIQRSLIEKTGYNFGFEYVQKSSLTEVLLASAKHPATAHIVQLDSGFGVVISSSLRVQIKEELARSFPLLVHPPGGFKVASLEELGRLLRRAASLAHSLPNQAVSEFLNTLEHELEQLPEASRGTEVERVVRQRVGQQAYRNAMLSYWGNACAVTGLAISEVLRASHAKPWADCDSDIERLDVFNGLLLSPNLDALFDRFLISFDNGGRLLVSNTITEKQRRILGVDKPLLLRWIAAEHLPYLSYHRFKFNKGLA